MITENGSRSSKINGFISYREDTFRVLLPDKSYV